MRNHVFLTSSITWLGISCILLLIYQFSSSLQVTPSSNSALSSKATIVMEESSMQDVEQKFTKIGFSQTTLFMNYSILPDNKATARTKHFLETLLTRGYIGRNGSFQNIFNELTIDQVLANLLLKPNVISHLHTVQISPSMLSVEQLKDCYVLCNLLISDLNNMYHFNDCSKEQITVLNTALGRLAFLKSLFKEELESYQAFDSSLDSNYASLDLLQNLDDLAANDYSAGQNLGYKTTK